MNQVMQALELANQARFAGADLKGDLKAGKVTLRDALLDDRALSLRVDTLLMAQRGWGVKRMHRALAGTWVTSSRRVRSLTENERTQVVVGANSTGQSRR